MDSLLDIVNKWIIEKYRDIEYEHGRYCISGCWQTFIVYGCDICELFTITCCGNGIISISSIPNVYVNGVIIPDQFDINDPCFFDDLGISISSIIGNRLKIYNDI